MPEAYSAIVPNDMSRLDRRSAYWGHRAAANTAHGTKFNIAYPRIQRWQARMESDGRALVASLRSRSGDGDGDGDPVKLIRKDGSRAEAMARLRAHYVRVAASTWAMVSVLY